MSACLHMCVCVCISGQHLAHSPLMMSTPDDVMVSISRASVVGFGVSVWRERKREEERMGLMGLGEERSATEEEKRGEEKGS